MTNEAAIATITEKFSSFTEAERVEFFLAVSKEVTFSQGVRSTAAEAVRQLNMLQFHRRVQSLTAQ